MFNPAMITESFKRAFTAIKLPGNKGRRFWLLVVLICAASFTAPASIYIRRVRASATPVRLSPLTFDMSSVHSVSLKLSGGNLALVDTNNPLFVLATKPASYTDTIVIDGPADINDELTIDYSEGFFANSVIFNGGLRGYDTLIIKGKHFDRTIHKCLNANDGMIELFAEGKSSTIAYKGLEPVSVSGTADLVIDLPPGAQAQLEDDGTPGNGQSQLRSLNGTFETTTFTNPSNSLTINAADATDSITLASLDSGFAASLIVNGSNSDVTQIGSLGGLQGLTINAAGNTNLNNISAGSGGISIGGATVTLHGALNTTGQTNIVSSGTLSEAVGGSISSSSLRTSSSLSTDLSGNNSVGTLAATVINHLQSFAFNNATALTIGSVGGSNGVSTNSGTITVTAVSNLTVAQPVIGTPGTGGTVKTVGNVIISSTVVAGSSNIFLAGFVPPTIGTYPDLDLFDGENFSVAPLAAPTNAVTVTAEAPGFEGLLTVDPVLGIVRITNAKQHGSYIVTVKAVAGPFSATQTFHLRVANPVDCGSGNRLVSRSSIHTGTVAAAVVIGDFNNDGNQDMAVADGGSNDVTVLLGDGNGGFNAAPGSPIPVGTSPISMVVGDFNDDGKQDLAIANFNSDNVTVLLGLGNGDFFPAPDPTVTVGTSPQSIVVGDFNNDGQQDLAVVNHNSNNITILLGNGNGHFNPATGSPISVGSFPGVLVVGDFNGDNNQDLAVTRDGDHTVLILLGSGAGTFSPAGLPIPVLPNSFGMVVGDFNEDGHTDLAVTSEFSNNVSILLGNGSGGFAPAPGSPFDAGTSATSLAVGDFNADGHQDLAVVDFAGEALTILQGNGSGGFVTAAGSPIPIDGFPGTIAVGDINNDFKLDLVMANQSGNSVSVFINRCNPRINSISVTAVVGAPPSNQTIANADDDPSITSNPLSVTINGGASATVNGVTVSNVHVSSIGAVTADVVATTSATTAGFTLTATDSNGLTASTPLTVTVNPNVAPTINPIGNVTILENAALQHVSLSGISPGAGDTGQSISITAVSSNPGLIQNPIVIYSSPDATGSLAFSPQPNQFGSATITVTVQDNGGTANGGADTTTTSFTINVTHVNQAPTLDAIANQTVPANSGPSTVNLTGIGPGPGDAGQTMTVSAASNNTALIPNPVVSYTSPNAAGSLTFTPVAGHTGTATITVTVHDNGGTANGGADTFTRNFNITVQQIASSTALATNVNPSLFGQTVTFTATVTAAPAGTGTPTGTVTFKEGSSVLGTGTLSGGVASFSISSLSVGSHTINAVYGGDSAFLASTSTNVNQTVNKANTTSTVSSIPNPSVYGQAVTFTASVSAASPGAGTPTGTVNFLDGTTSLGTLTLDASGHATLATNLLTVGTHSITITYSGDGNFNASTSPALTQTVNKSPTTVTLSSTPNPSVFGQSVTFTASVNPATTTTTSRSSSRLGSARRVGSRQTPSLVTPSLPIGIANPTGTVTFFDGSTILGTGTLDGTGQATFTTGSLAVGAHSITASYGGDGNYLSSTSSPLTQTVNKANTATANVISSANPSVFGQAVTFSTTVTAVAPGAGIPTGSVTFRDGATTIGTAALNASGQASFTTNALVVGSHSISASFSGDANFNASTSGITTQTVNRSATNVVVTSSANPAFIGGTLTFTATVVPTVPGAGVPTGTIQFKDNGTNIGGPVALVGGVASVVESCLTPGLHTITAVFSGDISFAPSTGTLAGGQNVGFSFNDTATGNRLIVTVPANGQSGNGTYTWISNGTAIVSNVPALIEFNTATLRIRTNNPPLDALFDATTQSGQAILFDTVRNRSFILNTVSFSLVSSGCSGS